MKLVIAAGGTGGHIFPALAVALEFRRRTNNVELVWVGTSRSRERQLCEQHAIALKILDVTGVKRKLSLSAIKAAVSFVRASLIMRRYLRREHVDAVVAFGGYVSAPVLAAARLAKVPYFIHEQNTVPGVVNRLFAAGARQTFLGFTLAGKRTLGGKSTVTGTPVRSNGTKYDSFEYPEGFSRKNKAILISGGSQGAASMNRCLLAPVRKLLDKGEQVVWQTGTSTFTEISSALAAYKNVFVFESIENLYPYYAASKIIICRAGASTLSEIAYFGLPCVLIPLPWAAENHQWTNAGLVEGQGWGIRVAQGEGCSDAVFAAVERLMTNRKEYELMCRRALDNSPENAAMEIVRGILDNLGKNDASIR